MIVDDYVEACDKYREKYGESTVCLFQIGDFFEMNAYFKVADEVQLQNKDYGEQKLMGADIYKVCDICNLQVTRKNKSVVETSRSNPLMAGFPLSALSKYTSILLAHLYTIVVVRQVTPPPNVTREVTEILSPSTIVAPSCYDANYLMCIVFDPFKETHVVNNSYKTDKMIMSIGVAIIDISTGQTMVYEGYSKTDDPNYTYDEINRLIESHNPREIYILETKQCTANPQVRRDIDNCVNTCNAILHHGTVQEESKQCFQEAVFRKTYKDDNNVACLSNYSLARIAFTAVLQFAYDHNDRVINKLKPPFIIEQSKYLTLQSNSAVQLQIIGTSHKNVGGEQPLIALLNRCSTSFGRRLFKDRLLAPVRDNDLLDKRYKSIERLIQDNKYVAVSKNLCQISDIERMARRIRLGTFPPMEWVTLHDSLYAAIQAITMSDVNCDVACESNNVIDTIRQMMDDFTKVLDLKEATKYVLSDIKGTIFFDGYNVNIDCYVHKLKDARATLESFIKDICEYEPCSLDSNDRDGYFINITKKRWDTVKSRGIKTIAGIKVAEFDARPLSSSSSTLKITHKVMEDASSKILDYQRILQGLVTEAYIKYLARFDEIWHNALDKIVMFIGDLDVAATNAKNAVEYNYVRPEIDHTVEGSYILGKAIRHPIIELIHTDVEYVPNDVSLGLGCTKGMLLYGINASGKSSYMKAVGINVIMAQAGMFVAASSFKLAPFHSIFTRIQNNDNVYKRMSSFTVEMTELRNIFQRCDKYSLVLGDELCAGTESMSAISIVASGTYNLLKKNVAFVFATHLHELVEIPIIQEQVPHNLNVAHMHVEVTHDSSGLATIIYDRKLRNGSGSAIYGLEVCDALGMPTEFIKVAHSVRKHITNNERCKSYGGCTSGGSLVDPLATSRYNSSVYTDNQLCSVCKKNPAVDVHHIQYQRDGGSNKSSNLAMLCKLCHDDEHNGCLDIKGYVETSKGRQLQYEWNSDKLSDGKSDADGSSLGVGMSLDCVGDVDDDVVLNGEQIAILKQFVRYGIAGWQIKKTSRSKWIPILHDSLCAFIHKKINTSTSMGISYNINSALLEKLQSKLLVI